jgi:hypothetical protein
MHMCAERGVPGNTWPCLGESHAVILPGHVGFAALSLADTVATTAAATVAGSPR